MASVNNNIGTTIIILAIVVILLGGLYFVSEDVSKNPNLGIDSQVLILDINYEYSNNFNANNSIVSNNSNYTFEGVDPFTRQYLESKTEITEKKSTLNKILNIPSLALKIFGVDNVAVLIAWNTIVYSLLVTLISLQLYKAIRTGEVD